MRYRFADCELDATRYQLLKAGEEVHVEPQVFDVLLYLVEHRNRVVTKTELLDAVWGDNFVSESALTSRIKAARKVVGDDGSAQAVIRTVHRRGYQFIATIDDSAGVADPVPDSDLTQEIRFCASADGVRLAYAVVGSGPPLVRAAHWLTHLDYDWHSPVWRHWLVGLGRDRSFVRYDERGCGLSDHDVADFSLDAWVNDLETVVDAVGLERFPLLGVSQGGPVAIEYAVRHPDRVSRLVLLGAYTQGRRVRARTEEERREVEVQLEMVRLGWAREDPSFRRFFSSSFIPDGTPELWEAFAELLRRTTSMRNAVRLMDSWADIDVTARAPDVAVPTLILHARDELRIPFSQARELASLIPDSRLVPLDSRNHLLCADEPAWEAFLDELDRFLDEDA